MRKSQLVLAVTVLIAVMAVAQHGPHHQEQRDRQMECPSPQMRGAMGLAMLCPLHELQPRVIPADDGGIFVIAGNRITKYDRELNEQNSITVELDRVDMQSMLRQRRDMMQMCRELMKEFMENEEDVENEENHEH
ncbi:hypothetical protein CHISP_3657 [Chitinispirillum alkaliphilum]|nr:hypothetical protein CHISP_3657 [Chitinispirillum alkaliphilum]